uniref:EF-hand domain-containing protein n=1 Tax=Panagrolaimus sp. JU765 TaxID=591449 RepID=A0AC34QGX1_9BILA
MRPGPRFVQLSDQLIDSLKAFFDSLDVDRSGFVEFDEICQRWRQFPPRSTSALPPNFLETLARTVPPSGLVNLERFLAGARISIAESRARRSNMKRVQSEGCNMHNLMDPPPLDHSNRDLLGSQPLYTTYQARKNPHPAMGVSGNKMPPPYTAPSGVGGLDSRENYCRVQLRQKKNGVDQDSRGPSRNGHFRPISTNSATTSSSMAEVRWRDSRMSTPLGDLNRHSQYLPEHSTQVVSFSIQQVPVFISHVQ